MEELVRAAALTGYFDVTRALGGDPERLLRAEGLLPAMLANPEQVIPARTVMRVLEASAAATNCPTFGLHLAAARKLADMGWISLVLAHQPSLREAFAVLARFRNRVNSTLVLHVEPAGDFVILREDFSLRTPVYSRQANDLSLGVLPQLCMTVLGADWRAESVCFTYPAPAIAHRDIYRRVFRCPVEFGAEFNGLVVPAADLDRPAPHADTALAEHARSLFESAVVTDERTVAQEVEQSIMLLLPSGRASIKASADALGMNVRTLQRHLEAENLGYSDLLHRVRMQLAQRYLSNPRARVTDVADLLGYASIGAFSRWHRQAFGKPPRRTRGARASGAGA